MAEIEPEPIKPEEAAKELAAQQPAADAAVEPKPLSPEEAAKELAQEKAAPPTAGVEQVSPEDAAKELKEQLGAAPEPLNPEDAALELEKRFHEKRVAPLYTGVSIAGVNLGILAIAAIPLAMSYHLHELGALPYVVLPFAISGLVCGWIARRRYIGLAAISLNICAVVMLYYSQEIFKV